jgi:hypothetical protein
MICSYFPLNLLSIEHPHLYSMYNGLTLLFLISKYHFPILLIQILRQPVHLYPLRFTDRLQTLHPRDDSLLVLLVFHHPLQKVVLLDPLFCDLQYVFDVWYVAVYDEGDARPELHVPEGTFLAFEAQEMFHIVGLLTIHHCVIVYIGLVLDKDQVSSVGSSNQLA